MEKSISHTCIFTFNSKSFGDSFSQFPKVFLHLFAICFLEIIIANFSNAEFSDTQKRFCFWSSVCHHRHTTYTHRHTYIHTNYDRRTRTTLFRLFVWLLLYVIIQIPSISNSLFQFMWVLLQTHLFNYLLKLLLLLLLHTYFFSHL